MSHELEMVRTPAEIALEIRALHKQSQIVVLGYAIEIGRRLVEVKSLLEHGEWGDWLRSEVDYSQSTANNFMKIFQEYGATQLGLFGPEAKSQTLGNLGYTKALKLLALPESEREDFVIEHDVENMSTRELDRLIRERDEALESVKSLNELLTESELQLESERKKYENDILAVKTESGKIEDALNKAKKAKEKAEEKYKQLLENPEIPPEALAKAAETAKESAAAEVSDKLLQAERELKSAQEELERLEIEKAGAERRAQEAEKRLAVADPDAKSFEIYFGQLQETYNKLSGLLMKISEKTPDMGTRFKAALRTVIENWEREL